MGVAAIFSPREPERPRTALAPDEERIFQRWYGGWAEKARIDPDPDNPLHKYDYRGAFKAGAVPSISPEDNRYHWPSEFKDDDHPNRFVRGADTKHGELPPPAKPKGVAALFAPRESRGFAQSFLEGATRSAAALGEGAQAVGGLATGGEPTPATLSPDRLAAIRAKPFLERFTDPDFFGDFLGSTLVGSAPSLTGALIGGVGGGLAAGPPGAVAGATVGSGSIAGLQTLGQTYLDERRAGKDHEAAVDTALQAGAAGATIAGAQVPLAFLRPFRGAISNALLQLAVQPAAEGTDQAVQNAIVGRPLGEGVPEAVVGGALFEAPAATVAGATVARGGEAAPGTQAAPEGAPAAEGGPQVAAAEIAAPEAAAEPAAGAAEAPRTIAELFAPREAGEGVGLPPPPPAPALAGAEADGSEAPPAPPQLPPPPGSPQGGESGPPAGRQRRPSRAPIVSFDLGDETLTDHFRRRVQDRLIRARRVVEAAEGAGRPVSDATDFNLQSALYYGRTAEALRKIEDETVLPLMESLDRDGISAEEFGTYLQARHTPARNAALRSQTGTDYDALSGMADDEASGFIAALERDGRLEAFQRHEAFFRQRVIDARIQIATEAGLMSDAQARALRQRFPDGTYVPLFVAGKARPGVARGRGFSTSGPEARKLAGGSAKPRDNPLIRSIIELQKTIWRAEKNRVGQSFLQFVRDNPNENIYTVSDATETQALTPESVRLGDGTVVGATAAFPEGVRPEAVILPDGTHVTEFVTRDGEPLAEDPRIRPADNVLEVKENGRRYLIEIKDEALARGMKNLDANNVPALLRNATSVFRALFTSLSPEFVVTNFARDIQQALINVSGEQSTAMAGQVAKGVRGAIAGVYANARGRRSKRFAATDAIAPRERTTLPAVRGEMAVGQPLERAPLPGREATWADWAQDLIDHGGKTGFFTLDVDVDTAVRNLEKRARRFEKKRTAQHLAGYVNEVGEFISDVNESVEMGVRLSFYRALVESGQTRERAALAAKELTLNFDRKGEIGPMLNTLYLFSNAGIQGGTRVLRAMRSPRVRRVLAGVTAGAVAISALNDQTNEKDWDTLTRTSPDLLERYLIVMKPGGGYVKAPLPYGYNVFKSLGDTLYAWGRGRIDGGEALKRMVLALDSAFNPLSSPNLTQMLSPTVADPFVQNSTNTDWLGRPIKPEGNPFAPYRRESARYFKSVSPKTKAVTEWLNDVTGGNDVEAGAIDVSPEDVDNIISFLSGGLGRFISNSVSTATTLASGELPDVRDVPFLRTIYSDRVPGPLADVYDTWRKAGAEVLVPREVTTFYEGMAGAIKTKEMDGEQAGNKLSSFTLNQARVLAARDVPPGSRTYDRTVERITRTLRMDPRYRRLDLQAKRLRERERR